MSEHFDAVVVGSGFGGSVVTYRLADAGMSVCLLERGKPYPPGTFARGPRAMSENFWDPSEGGHGLFDVWSFRHLEAIVSSGLGGGSLIYANVLIRKDPKWFVTHGWRDGVYEYWPVQRQDLDRHYDNVEQILKPQKYPIDHPCYATLKTVAFRDAAKKLGLEWYTPNLAVTFANEGAEPHPGQLIREEFPNLHGEERSTCRLCGECDVGCNYGSKNTLDYNYLTLAQLKKAVIRTRHEVRTFRPRAGGGFAIDYVVHEKENEGRPTATRALEVRQMTADRLVLSAGTFGTTYLLLNASQDLPGLSPLLGHRFSGNGDMLTFALRCTTRNGGPPAVRRLDASQAPVITSTIRVPDEEDGGTGRGFYLQDAGYPEFANWLLETAQVPGVVSRVVGFALHRLRALLTGAPQSELGGEIARLIGNGTLSCSSMPILGMGRDQPDGVMSLERDPSDQKDYLAVEYSKTHSAAYFKRVEEVSRQVAEAMGGEFRDNPLMQYLNRIVTVHPLGGCSMGRNQNEGVVDPFGEVFGWPGLYVADGSVMPGPVGANPSLTIAALADRFAENIIDTRSKGRTR